MSKPKPNKAATLVQIHKGWENTSGYGQVFGLVIKKPGTLSTYTTWPMFSV